MKYLHYVDSQTQFPVRSGLEDLPERIDISLINEVAIGGCAALPNLLRDQGDLTYNVSQLQASPLSFALLTAGGGLLAAQIAPDKSRWADWTDGLNMLRRDGGHVASQETELFVQALTDIGLKVRLLSESSLYCRFIRHIDYHCWTDLSGDKAEIPSGIVQGQPPTNNDFFFSDLLYDTQG